MVKYLGILACWLTLASAAVAGPQPMVKAGEPVNWWFAYKFNSSSFPSDASDTTRRCPFGGAVQTKGFSQKYAFATDADPTLRDGTGLIGTSDQDPLGATFGAIYTNDVFYVVWNDQFYGDPLIKRANCDAQQCGAPWAHSKGMLAWDAAGDGVYIQVTTPSWPGAGSHQFPRHGGNTLGCINKPNNISNAQHFFAVKLTHADVAMMLKALAVAGVATDTANSQVVSPAGTGMPADLAQLVAALPSAPPPGSAYLDATLSSGVRVVVKPNGLHVPPWQFLSSVLGGVPLRSATWWASPRIPTTVSGTTISCWDTTLTTPPGPVEIAKTGHWSGKEIGLVGGQNHAKIGVSTDTAHHYVVLADLNQQGALTGKCASSQNGRGGMFLVIDDANLAAGVTALIAGQSANPGEM